MDTRSNYLRPIGYQNVGRKPVCTENLIRVDDVMESPNGVNSLIVGKHMLGNG
jgi:hypothetical protein